MYLICNVLFHNLINLLIFVLYIIRINFMTSIQRDYYGDKKAVY
jgi:uncharacterized protein YqhQ